MQGIYERKPFDKRFWEKVNIKGNDDCWEWKGATVSGDYGGYGQFRIDGKIIKAHRVSWELYYGSIPEGMQICHRCDNPLCVNPNHLFLGTQSDNMKDAYNKGRSEVGHNCILTEYKVQEIRSKYGWYGQKGKCNMRELSKMYGVTMSNISDIIHNRTWKRV